MTLGPMLLVDPDPTKTGLDGQTGHDVCAAARDTRCVAESPVPPE